MARWTIPALSVAPATTNHMAIAGRGDVIHFFYRDGTNIQYRKSTDNGKTFAAATTIGTCDEIPLDQAAAISPDGTQIHLFYDRSNALWYLRSTDGGANWQTEVQMDTFGANIFIRLSVVCQSDSVHVAWVRTNDTTFATDGLFYARSQDNGANWDATTQPIAGTTNPARPSMSEANGNIHLCWNDQRYGGTPSYSGQPGEAVTSRSTDDGTTWGSVIRLSNTQSGGNTGTVLRPAISAGNDKVVAVWQDPDGLVGTEDLYYAYSIDEGATYSLPLLLAAGSAVQEHAFLKQSGETVLCVWADYRTGTAICYYAISRNGGQTWEKERAISGTDVTPAPRACVTDTYFGVIIADGSAVQYFTRSLVDEPTLPPQVKFTSFALATSTGNQQVTNLGGGWKAGIFWLVALTADGTAGGFSYSIGFAISSTQRGCMSALSEDTPTIMDTFRGISNTKLLRGFADATGPTMDYEVDFVSWDSDGFTINVTDAPASAYIVLCLLFGGDGLEAAEIDSFNVTPSVATQNVTNFADEYDVMFFLQDRHTSASFGDDTHNIPGIGVAVNGSGQGSLTMVDTDAAGTSQVKAWQRADECIIGAFTGTSVTENMRGRVTTFNADGFSLAWDTQTTDTPGSLVLCLGLKGGLWWCGSDLQRTSAGTQAKTAVGFRPNGLLMFSTGVAAGTGITRRTGVVEVGAADAAAGRGCASAATADAAGTANTDQRLIRTKVIQHITTNAVVSAEADLASFDEDGYTLNWTTADGTARESVVVAVGARQGAAIAWVDA